MTKKELLDRCARDGDERILLARVLDKVELAANRGVPACTQFLWYLAFGDACAWPC